jgi:hypothetical protein
VVGPLSCEYVKKYENEKKRKRTSLDEIIRLRMAKLHFVSCL